MAGSAIANGCGGDDSIATDGDSGSYVDATTGDSSPVPLDGATGDSGGTDANAKPHVVFVTSDTFAGDLIDEAIAMDEDGGVAPSGLDAGDDGGGGSTYVLAADTICMHSAKTAGLLGNFRAIIAARSDVPLAGVTDSDGPWARLDGVRVADTASDLRAFSWQNPIDVTEKGTTLGDSSGTTNMWNVPTGAPDTTSCNGWTSASVSNRGGGGSGPESSRARSRRREARLHRGRSARRA